MYLFDGLQRAIGNVNGGVQDGSALNKIDNVTVKGVLLTPMAYVSSTTTQPNTTNVGVNTTNQEVICMQIVTSGTTSPLSATSFTVNAAGTTAIADINAANSAKIYYTGTSSTFATTTLFGQNTPTIANFNITGTQTLATGTNYFWLVYDVKSSATLGNFIDGQCSSITIGTAKAPTVTNPAGSRQIAITYCNPAPSSVDGTGITNVTLNTINNTSVAESGNYGDYSAQIADVEQGVTVNCNITYKTGYAYFTKIWVDWNNDGDFADAGEEVYSGESLSANPTTLAATFTVPPAATLGNHRMRIGGTDSATPIPCYTGTYGTYEDYTLNVTVSTTMSYVSSTVTQTVTTTVAPGATAQQIIGIQVVTTGTTSPLNLTSFTLNAVGTTAITDINGTNSAKIYYTGASSTFATTTLFGQNTPTIADYTITGTQTLSNGTNYFWLVYDISASAVVNNVVDAQCSSLTVSSARTPSVTSPAGNRTIAFTYCVSSATSTADMDITNVTLGTLDNDTPYNSLNGSQTVPNATGTAGMYSNWVGTEVPIPSVMQSSTYPISVSIADGGSEYSHRIDAYIDFNKDGDFSDVGELFPISASANPTTPYTVSANITIPASASVGTTLMRIVCVESTTSSACGTYSWGETEDYAISITAMPGCSGTPTAGTATSDIADFCGTGTPFVSLSGYTVASGITFKWQTSPNGSAWTDITGATASTYLANPDITATTYYKATVTCTNSGNSSVSNSVVVTNTSQTIIGTNSPQSVACGNIANLTASSSGGTIYWYAAEAGGTALATGGSYAPTVIENTTYYVAAGDGGSTGNVGKVSSDLSDGYYGGTGTGLVFNALADFTLVSVKAYVQTAGSAVSIVLKNSAGTVLETANYAAVPTSGLYEFTLDFDVATGTGFRLESNNSVNLARDFSSDPVVYPYTLAGICSITGGYLSGASTSYYFFYDWVVSTGCESARVPVVVTLSGGTSAPECSNLLSPANAATGIESPGTTLTWAASADDCQVATSYKLYFGTDNPPTNILNGTNIGNVLSYATGALSAPETYYWKIVPVNAQGEATGCSIRSFNTVNTAIIGTGTSTSSSVTPYKGGYRNGRVEYIYTAAELIAAGITPGSTITDAAFNVSSKYSSAPYTGFNLKIAHTTAATFASINWLAVSWTTLYSNNYTTTTAWNKHGSASFVWNGSDNIVVEACFDNASSTSSDPVYFTTTSGNTVCYAENDVAGDNGCTLAAETTSTNRANIKLFFVPLLGESDIISANNEVPNINYSLYQNAALNTTADGIKVWSFTLRDGGADLTDADGNQTNLSSLVISKGSGNSVTSWASTVRRAAILDGAVKVAEIAVTGETLNFTGLTGLTAPDNGSNTFDLYISFESTVTDNEQFEFEIKSSNNYSYNASSSYFDVFTTKSAIDSDKNRIVIIATQLAFTEQPEDTQVAYEMFPDAPEVSAVDALGNIDIDFIGTVTISSTGAMTGGTITYPLVNGTAICNGIYHTALASGRTLTATGNGWSVVSSLFNIVNKICSITSTPAHSNGELYVCEGAEIDFAGNYTGTVTSWIWRMGDGSETKATGTDLIIPAITDYKFTTAAGYYVELTVNGSGGTCATAVRVMVSGGPVITNVSSGLTTCDAGNYNLSAGGTSGSAIEVVNYGGTGAVALSLAQQTYLPDITTSAVEYTTTLSYTQFDPTATLTNPGFVTVYANLEHSYFGDLEIWLECPTGQTARLTDGYHNAGLSSEFLGEPVDEDVIGTPGDGYDYRWTENAPTYNTMEYYANLSTFPFKQSFTDNAGTSVTNHDYFPTGSYTPYEAFSNFVGCPLNGDWTIHVKDWRGVDDGYIFEWGLELDESLMPGVWNYTAGIADYDWTGTGVTEVHYTGQETTVWPQVIGANIYTLHVYDDYNCETTQDVTITVVECFNQWTGAVDTDWSKPGNWSESIVPTCAGEPVTIPNVSADSGNFPVIVTVAECNNITIDAGASVTIAPNWSLTVCGNVINNNGVNGIKVQSNSTGTGSLIHNTTGVLGTVSKFIPGTRFHYFGSPISDGTTTGIGINTTQIYDWDASAHWNGMGANPYGNPSTIDYTPWGTTYSGALSVGTGYAYYHETQTLNFAGTLNVNDVSLNLLDESGATASDDQGWNLISNPYSSAIDWDVVTSAGWDNDVEKAIYFFNGVDGTNSQDNYRYYVPASGSGGTYSVGTGITNRFVPVAQGFFVKSNRNNQTLNILATDRAHSTQAYYKGAADVPAGLMRIKIFKNGKEDETVLRFIDGASDYFDGDFDSRKLFPNDFDLPQVFIVNEDAVSSAIASFGELTESKNVKLGYLGKSGNMTLQAVQNSVENVQIYLEDLVLHTYVNFANQSYTFNHTGGLVKDRFVLHFVKNHEPVILHEMTDFVSKPNASISIPIFAENYTDLDFADAVTVSIDQATLPEWLTYNAENRTLTGYCPSSVRSQTISVVIQDRFGLSVIDKFELTTMRNEVDMQAVSGIEVSVFPNPNIGYFNIQTSVAIDEIQVLDLSGRVLSAHTDNVNRLNLTNLPTGMYQLKIKLANSQIAVKNVMIQK